MLHRFSATLALFLASSPAFATTWADYEELFPTYPCQDGWVGCVVQGEHITAEPMRGAEGTPVAADQRIDFLSLEPTAVFNPFGRLSDYSGVAAPAAAPPPPPPVEIPPPPPPAPDVVAVAPSPAPAPITRPDPRPAPAPMTRPDPSPAPAPTMVRPDPAPAPAPSMVRPNSLTAAPSPAPQPSMVRPDPTPAPAPAPAPTMVRPDPAPAAAPEPAVAEAKSGPVTCDDLKALEPSAMLGRLSSEQIACLESSLQASTQQTDKKAISLVMMQDAWSKSDKKTWEKLVKRHLAEIDQSDPDLCYKYAQVLYRMGSGRASGVIRWADVALENKTRWSGETYTSRVYNLYKLRAGAQNKIWMAAEDEHAKSPSAATDEKRSSARSKTKVMAREWYDYAKGAGKDTTKALQLCVSAAGTQDYCEGG